MVTHFSILAWRIPWTGEPGGLQSMGGKDMTERVTLSFFMDFSAPMNTPKIISKICVSIIKDIFLESTPRKKVKKANDRC